MSGEEFLLVQDAFESNWIAPLGPHVDAFEREFANYLNVTDAAALSSGTAALHLALRLIGIQPGDEVLCSTFSFCATANAILYEGGKPVFIDSDSRSWNIDPELVGSELKACAVHGKLPKAVIAVDLYGQCADYEPLLEACAEYGIPLIEDAAESLGATYRTHPAGTMGRIGIFSFNGNKIITTSGGGMLVSDDPSYVRRARFLATQARDPAPHYQHSTIGYNYRLSNVLAAIGRGQLRVLPERVEARRRNFEVYQELLEDLPGISFMPEAEYGRSTRWLTCLCVEPELFGASRDDIRLALQAHEIEARPVWKPLHLQPAYEGFRHRGGTVSEQIFQKGLCLPSGSNLSTNELELIAQIIKRTHDD